MPGGAGVIGAKLGAGREADVHAWVPAAAAARRNAIASSPGRGTAPDLVAGPHRAGRHPAGLVVRPEATNSRVRRAGARRPGGPGARPGCGRRRWSRQRAGRSTCAPRCSGPTRCAPWTACPPCERPAASSAAARAAPAARPARSRAARRAQRRSRYTAALTWRTTRRRRCSRRSGRRRSPPPAHHQVGLGVADQRLDGSLRLRVRRLAEVGALGALWPARRPDDPHSRHPSRGATEWGDGLDDRLPIEGRPLRGTWCTTLLDHQPREFR
jgi:hypothetical protein